MSAGGLAPSRSRSADLPASTLPYTEVLSKNFAGLKGVKSFGKEALEHSVFPDVPPEMT
jgi:hypothetical protein